MNKENMLNFKELYPLYAYGDEYPTLKMLSTAFKIFNKSEMNEQLYTYDYRKLIDILKSEELAWATIHLLDAHEMIDWGTSIRFGWLDGKGVNLREYFEKYTVDELYQAVHIED